MYEDEDDYETDSELAVLNINTKDIYSGSRNFLFPAEAIASDDLNVGFLTNYGAKIVIKKLDLERLLGDMFYRYEIFSIDLKLIKTIFWDTLPNSLKTNQSIKYRNSSIFLEGLDFISNNGAQNKNRAHLTNISTIYSSENQPYDVARQWYLPNNFIEEIQTDDSKYYFRKHYGMKPFIISLGSLFENEPITTEPIFDGNWQIAPPFIFKFIFKPVS